VIEVRGVGGGFDDRVLVSAVHHQLAEGNWTTTAEFGEARIN
jgi:hypothetical protein